MIRTKLWLAAAVGQCLFAAIAVAQDTRAQDRELVEATEAPATLFDITTHTDDEIAGEFRSGSLHIIFKSRLEGPSRVVIQLRLGDDILEADVDLEQETAVLDGHGKALSEEELAILVQFGNRYEEYLDPDRRDPLIHEDIFYRALSVWCQHPPGIPIDSRFVSASAANQQEGPVEPEPGPEPKRFAYHAVGPSCGGPDDSEHFEECNLLFPCAIPNAIPIRPLPGGCICQYYEVWHDAGDHPGVNNCCLEIQGAGCDLDSGCQGKCGPGCDGSPDCRLGGSFGAGIYTFDCLEHDRCRRVHGDGPCLDEFDETIDDCLFGELGAENCEGCPDPCENGSGNCCSENGTPGCNNESCCNLVCDLDPFCCNNNWDNLCANEASEHCFPLCCGDGTCGPEENCSNCPTDCDTCGDGCCIGGENDCNCSQDCNPQCGDGCCTGSENDCNCSQDCNPQCGDGCCTGGENDCNCSQDCNPQCGDSCCTGGENDCNCSQDCNPQCGDGCCTGGENDCNCSIDCDPQCGDGCCTGGENDCNCSIDCDPQCGDGCCTGNENACNCPGDGCTPFCGDGCCNGNETACTCPGDGCTPLCGDGCCNGNETACTCPGDGCTPFCGDGCCNGNENACTCPGDGCTPTCGDGCCNGNENACTCPGDGCTPTCGDGCCTGGENCDTCPADCGDCTTGSDCNDGNPCTQDLCADGCCQNPSEPPGTPCPDDGNPCADDECNGSGQCVHTPECTSDPQCNDGNACTDDACVDGCCVISPTSCGDGTCDPACGEDCNTCPEDCGGPCCGNGQIDPGEECDPPDDSECPGQCMPDCTCGDGDGCVLFDDQGEFEAFTAAEEKTLKGIETFEESILPAASVDGMDDPLCGGVPNAPDAFPFPNGLDELNLCVQSNFEHGPNAPNPRGADGIVAASAGFLDATSDIVLANFFVDSIDAVFSEPNHTGIGFNTLAFLGGTTVDIRIYDTNNNLLATGSSPADPAGSNFFGVWCPDSIGRINIHDPANGAEGGDNIQMWIGGDCDDPPPVCGDGICDTNCETSDDCPIDCPCGASRELPSTYCPESASTICIHLDPPDGTQAIGVEDSPPAGWIDISNITHGGQYDAGNHKVKWGPLFEPFPEAVCYDVTPPAGANGEKCFSGTASFDGNNESICGDQCFDGGPLFCCPPICADEPQPPCEGCVDCACGTCEDHRVELCEVIGYSCAWKKGCNDDIGCVTRSAFIWKSGECYCWDDFEENWFPDTCPGPETGCCADPLGSEQGGGPPDQSGSALAQVPDAGPQEGKDGTIVIPIVIEAPEGTSAMAVEYFIPEGWEVVNLSDGGTWDEQHRKAKWGPFFDDLSRTVTVSVRPLTTDAGRDGFFGTVSFDGINRGIGRDRLGG